MVQAFILNNNGTYDDARDVFQEAMITLYEKAKSESFVLTCQIKTYAALEHFEIKTGFIAGSDLGFEIHIVQQRRH